MSPKHCLCNTAFRALMLAFAAVALAGCEEGGGEGEPGLTVSAASSLTDLFRAYGELAPGDERFSFAGSDQLAAGIRSGADPDLFASASFDYPRELAREGLLSKPVRFASNRLVVAVRRDSELSAVDQLRAGGIDLVIGAPGVPAGDYAREVIAQLPEPVRGAIEANVRSREADVRGVVGKVAQGAADAGFAYASDVAAIDELRAIELPARLQPPIAYAIAVVSSSDQPEAARAFIDGLTSRRGRRLLAEAGFGPPPGEGR